MSSGERSFQLLNDVATAEYRPPQLTLQQFLFQLLRVLNRVRVLAWNSVRADKMTNLKARSKRSARYVTTTQVD